VQAFLTDVCSGLTLSIRFKSASAFVALKTAYVKTLLLNRRIFKRGLVISHDIVDVHELRNLCVIRLNSPILDNCPCPRPRQCIVSFIVTVRVHLHDPVHVHIF
jgi:hypothetical protein